MSEDLHHFCGVAAAYHLSLRETSPIIPGDDINQTARLIPRILLDIQNRGQLAAGISSFSDERRERLKTYKQLGTVHEAFSLNRQHEFEELMKDHHANAAIGHVRYCTAGDEHRDSSQPFERKNSRLWKWYSFAFNGQVTNYEDLKREFLSDDDQHLIKDTDSELLMHIISQALRGTEEPSLKDVFAHLAEKLEGAWSIVFLNGQGDMVVARDPVGFRPLSWAFDGSLFAAASEDIALWNLGFKEVQALGPGEMVHVRKDKSPEVIKFAESKRTAHCALEWIYFANVASTLDNSSVYVSRSALGKELAMQELATNDIPLDDDTIVVPVPDTAKAAGDSMAYHLKIRSMEGIVRNRYVGRTFIQGSGDRGQRAKTKYTPLRKVLEGKRVILVDDTIVRSTTMLSLLHELRHRGKVKEIHIRVACPPLIGPCFYGLDISTVSELFVPNVLGQAPCDAAGEKKLADALGVESLRFLPPEALPRAIGIDRDQLCMACMTGDHPTKTGEKLYQQALENTFGQKKAFQARNCG